MNGCLEWRRVAEYVFSFLLPSKVMAKRVLSVVWHFWRVAM